MFSDFFTASWIALDMTWLVVALLIGGAVAGVASLVKAGVWSMQQSVKWFKLQDLWLLVVVWFFIAALIFPGYMSNESWGLVLGVVLAACGVLVYVLWDRARKRR